MKYLTLMLLDRHDFGNGGLQDPNVSVDSTLSRPFSPHFPRNSSMFSLRPYPLSSPPNARASRAIGRFGAKPNSIMLRPVPAKPPMRTGLRPILSLIRPQITLVENSAKAKADVIRPA